MRERFRPVLGFEGLYEVGDQGTLRRAGHGTNRRAGAVLHGGLDRDGYRQFVLCKNGRRYRRALHRLVLEAFRGPGVGRQGRHLDDNRDNNRLVNLAWGTAQDNSDDRVRNGASGKGSANSRAKLTEEQARAIRASSEPTRVLAAMYGVGRSTIQSIRAGRTWSHLKG